MIQVSFRRNDLYSRGKRSDGIWFLYEYLQEVTLDINDLKQGNFVHLVARKFQYAGSLPRGAKGALKSLLHHIEEISKYKKVYWAGDNYKINKTRFVAEATQEKVMKAVDELNYAPSAVSAILKGGALDGSSFTFHKL